MTTAQKVIKYIATAFAVFLIVTIISAILNGGYALLKAFGLIHTDRNIVTEDLKVISSEVEEISTLKLELAFANLEIKTGDSFRVETNNSKITFSNDNGSVKVKEEKYNWSANNDNASELIIYIPENITVLDEAKIDGGVGRTELKSCEINNLKANLGMGEFVFSGKLTGKSEVDSGVGAINIDLLDSSKNYTIDLDKGIGAVTLNGEKLEMDRVYGTGENYLDIDSGIGEVKINFKGE